MRVIGICGDLPVRIKMIMEGGGGAEYFSELRKHNPAHPHTAQHPHPAAGKGTDWRLGTAYWATQDPEQNTTKKRKETRLQARQDQTHDMCGPRGGWEGREMEEVRRKKERAGGEWYWYLLQPACLYAFARGKEHD